MSNKTNILLVEDDPNLGSLLQEYIIAKGYDCQLETDGDKGLKAFLKGSYDLCALDVMMPIKDGFTLAKEIRNTDKKIPIIFSLICLLLTRVSLDSPTISRPY